jgi:hypothetical protein
MTVENDTADCIASLWVPTRGAVIATVECQIGTAAAIGVHHAGR